MTTTRTLSLLAVFAVLAGCSKDRAAAVPEPTPVAAPAAVAPAAAPPSDPAAFLRSTMSLGERMQLERASRPAATPRAEDVLTALARAGVALDEPRQHMAAPIGAKYCVGAHTSHDVAISVCEYADEASAKAGRDTSARAFAAIQHRDVLLNKTTTLTTLQAKATPEQADDAKRAAEAFARM